MERQDPMPYWKWLLLHLYLPVTAPWRAWHLARLCARGRAPIMVLLFHRVADDRANPWTISTADFTSAIEWLRRGWELVSLDEAQRRIASGRQQRPAVAITFDDGYAENCDAALPLLIEYGIPCTYFVTSQNVLQGRPFPHDLRQGRRFPPNTLDQLRQLVDAGIEIGAHTRTHANLGRITCPVELHAEIAGGRDDLQQALGVEIPWFAFPFGGHEHLSGPAMEVARQAGFTGVVSAYGGYNYPGDDPFHVQRIGGDGPALRIKNWITYDPRQARRIVRFTTAPRHEPAALTA